MTSDSAAPKPGAREWELCGAGGFAYPVITSGPAVPNDVIECVVDKSALIEAQREIAELKERLTSQRSYEFELDELRIERDVLRTAKLSKDIYCVQIEKESRREIEALKMELSDLLKKYHEQGTRLGGCEIALKVTESERDTLKQELAILAPGASALSRESQFIQQKQIPAIKSLLEEMTKERDSLKAEVHRLRHGHYKDDHRFHPLKEENDQLKAEVERLKRLHNECETKLMGTEMMLTFAEEENEKLTAELAECKSILERNEGRVKAIVDETLVRERDQLRALAEKMAKTLQFYAKQDKGPYHSPAGGNYMSIENDSGKRAREVLVPWYTFKERNKSE